MANFEIVKMYLEYLIAGEILDQALSCTCSTLSELGPKDEPKHGLMLCFIEELGYLHKLNWLRAETMGFRSRQGQEPEVETEFINTSDDDTLFCNRHLTVSYATSQAAHRIMLRCITNFPPLNSFHRLIISFEPPYFLSTVSCFTFFLSISNFQR
jgi:hypothetical protein